MRVYKHIALFIGISILFLVSFTSQDSAKEIIQKSLDKVNGLTSKGIMEMKIVRPKWSRTVTMKSWSKGSDYSMIYITAPASDKGQVFLKRETEMWNWIPTINRMMKIPPSMMNQGWMGSDFTNDDLVKMNSLIRDYSHKILRTETIGGLPCHLIELIPHPDAPVVWGKIEMWISKKEFFQMKAIYYDEDMEGVTKMTASEIKNVGNRTIPSKLVMIPLTKKNQKTIMTIKKQTFDIKLDESFFSQQNMKRVK
jgi:outer membrane lipoprotein-sorting protein